MSSAGQLTVATYAFDGSSVVISQPKIADFAVAVEIRDAQLHFGKEISVRARPEVAQTLDAALASGGDGRFVSVPLKTK